MSPEDWTYFVDRAAWSGIGLLVGWVATSWWKDLHAIKEAVVDSEEDESTQDHPQHKPKRDKIGIILLVMGIVAGAIMSYGLWRQQQQIDCQTEINARFNETLKQRAHASEGDKDALRDLVKAIVEDPPGAQRALEEFLERMQKTAKKRAENPYPPLPEESCG